MTEFDAGRVDGRRAVKAALLVAMAIAAVPVVDAVLRATEPAQGVAAMSDGFDAAAVLRAPDAEGVLGSLEKLAAADGVEQSAIPEAIWREVGFLSGARDARVGADGQVVGYVVDGESALVLEQLEAHMKSLGWKAVSLGGLDGATFLKEGGECTWAFATCTQSGSATCVVVRLNQRGVSPLVH